MIGEKIVDRFSGVARSVFGIVYGLSGTRRTNREVSYDGEDHVYVK